MASSTNKSGTVSFTSGTLWKQLTLFALPVALTGIVQQLFHSADTAVIGHYVGKNAMAAVGCSGPLVNLLLEFFIGLSNSAGVVIARFLGRNDGKRPNDAVHTAVPAAILCGFLAAGPGIILSSPTLRLMSVPDEIFSDALLYLRVYLIGMPFFMLNQFLCAIFRSKGDSSTPLICLTAAGAVNV